MRKIFISTLAIISLFSCNNPGDQDPAAIFKRKIEKMDMESFKIPDSINTSLIIASYYNSEYDSQTFFVYNDVNKKSVKKIDYLSDSTVTVDQLEILKRNEFRSTHYNVDYVVKENSVSLIHLINCSQVSPPILGKEYRRTDRD